MRICDDLRQAVLQAAIQGKLTKQLPEDGNAADLLKEIAKEKNQLIKEGKIKKEKPLPEIKLDEVPFDIPENWKWVRLGYLTNKLVDGTHKTPKYTSEGIKFVSVKNISSGYLSLANTKYISEKEHKELYERCNPEKGDILLSKVGTTGVPAIIDTDEQFSLFVSVALLKFSQKHISNKFFYFLLLSPLVQQQAKDNTRGVGNKNWVLDSISNTLLVLPPFAEQRRIVARVEELMARIDDLEKTETELEKLKAAFPGDMKAALLQAATQGKLTEQLPEDGDAADLINQITKEKNQLIKEGKIKKEKPLPEITTDEMPFDIPDNWEWVRLSNLIYLTSGNQYKETNVGSLYIKVAEMNLPENINEITTSDKFVDKNNLGEIPIHSIIFPKRGGAIFTNKKRKVLQEPIFIDSNTMAMTCIVSSIFDFLYKWFSSIDLGKLQTGTSIPQINNKDLYPLLVPLPPLAEQKRVIEKLDKLLPLCDGLVEE